LKFTEIVVCGNLTIDELVTAGGITVSPGGSAVFCSCAAAYLGARVGILGNVGEDYSPTALRRIKALHPDLSMLRRTAKPSARFRITRLNGSRRLQLIEPGRRIVAPQSGFGSEGVHLGPVFNEVSNSLVKTLRKRCNFMSADLQGFIRTVSGTTTVQTVSRDLSQLFKQCDMVQASIDEAQSQARARDPRQMLKRFLTENVRYAVVTMGERGSWLGSKEKGTYFVPAFPDRTIRDSTGAGDVFAGSWLRTFLSTKDPVWASSVGSAFASLASRRTGLSKFRISRRELFRRASWVYHHVKPTLEN
jgi:sugar/nucleoside kinase (ribokinase family)